MRVVMASAALCVLLLACGCGSGGGGGPSATGEGESWTHKEFLAHLKSKGVEYEVIERGGGAGSPIPPFVELRLLDGGKKVEVRLCPDAKAAREAAAAWGEASSFAWGRFVVQGDREAVAVVRKALTSRPQSP